MFYIELAQTSGQFPFQGIWLFFELSTQMPFATNYTNFHELMLHKPLRRAGRSATKHNNLTLFHKKYKGIFLTALQQLYFLQL